MSRPHRSSEDREMGMEPMVDVVFQLLIFFLFTFHVRLLESLYPVEVTSSKAEATASDERPQVVVLEAGLDGELSGIRLDGARLESLGELETELRKRGEGQEHADRRVLLRPATMLKYEHVVDGALAVSRAGRQVQLVSSGSGATSAPREVPHEKP